MWIPVDAARPSVLLRRDGQDDDSKHSTSKPNWRAFTVAGVIAAVFLIIAVGCYAKLRSLRAKPARPPTRLPGNFLQRKWRQWTPRSGKGRYSSQLQQTDTPARRDRAHSSPEREMQGTMTETPAEAAAAAAVNRNTSIRSVMTLPAYSPAVRENERILAREGERAGVDVVIEFPETVDEEEARRDDEMESLYQIRVARRAEQVERDERRRRRREARERGDLETLAQLRRESRQRQENGGFLSASLIAEHQAAAAQRERRVSSVQYADLGVARHDGTRVRANSAESDNRPLLDSAASFGASRPTSSRMTHHRDCSATSVLSNSTNASEEWTTAHRSSNTSGNTDFEVITLSRSRSPSGSRLTLAPTQGSDVGEARIPPPDPPQYDDVGWEEAPPYSSPVDTRTPQLPALQRLPSIHITASVTPVEERPPQRVGEPEHQDNQAEPRSS